MNYQTIQNELLRIRVKDTGAELCEISSVGNNESFLWNGDAKIWGNFAPNLFPVIGNLKNGGYWFKKKFYKINKHGFIRGNTSIKLYSKSKNKLCYQLKSNKNSYESYPFNFEYYVSYTLIENKLIVMYEVLNKGKEKMLFQIGGHPAFKCPIEKGEEYADHEIIFDAEESATAFLLDKDSGLLTNNNIPIFRAKRYIDLNHKLFEKDALIYKTLNSKSVCLNSKKSGPILNVNFEGFPNLGLWAKTNANYICIEPWHGITDDDDYNGELEYKNNIIRLEPLKEFKVSFTIEISKKRIRSNTK